MFLAPALALYPPPILIHLRQTNSHLFALGLQLAVEFGNIENLGGDLEIVIQRGAARVALPEPSSRRVAVQRLGIRVWGVVCRGIGAVAQGRDRGYSRRAYTLVPSSRRSQFPTPPDLFECPPDPARPLRLYERLPNPARPVERGAGAAAPAPASSCSCRAWSG